MMPWFIDLLGLPWESKAMGPHAFDCWGLVVHVMRERYGITVSQHLEAPSYDVRAFSRAVEDEIRSALWTRVEAPQEGDVVLMSRGRAFYHVGIFTEGGVLHSAEKCDVCHESLSHLKRSGVLRFEYWRHR